ncbi:MAG TPA: polyprenyl synthetase family protein [Edaphocola sp.]|nr:polyprenyl synthetase family protein [Edaphocola sp.]
MSQILTKLPNVNLGSIGKKTGFINSEFNEVLNETDIVVSEKIIELVNAYVEQPYRHIVLQSTKNKDNFDRAFFVRIGFELFKPNWTDIKDALSSVELRYSNLVVTDDIFDNNDFRLSQKSIKEEYGVNTAISIALILKSLASLALNENSNSKTILTSDESSHISIYEGQLMDISTEKMKISSLSENFYLDMIRKTTGDDVGYCFELGGRLAGCDEQQAENLKNLGVSLGTAMQLRDDLLDYINDVDAINKKPLRDFTTRKLRLPLFLAYKFSNDFERNRMDELYNSKIHNEEDIDFICNQVFKEEVVIYIENLLNSLKTASSKHFELIDSENSKIKSVFYTLINNVIKL